MFSCEFWEISQSTFFTEHLQATASLKKDFWIIKNKIFEFWPHKFGNG